MTNILPQANLCTDGYKLGHPDQFPPNTQSLLFNITARGFDYAHTSGCVLPDFDDHVLVAGVQHVCSWYLKDYWDETFFNRELEDVLKEFDNEHLAYLGKAPRSSRWEKLWRLGYLPIVVWALPEGARVKAGVPHMIWSETKPEFSWLPGFLETAISSEYWGFSTNATIAFEYRRLLERYAVATGSPKEFVTWQAHDFSYRGLRGVVDGALHQVSHLFSFRGTDTFSAINHARKYYTPKDPNEYIGGSVAATEHSTASLNIQWEYSKLTEGTHEEKLVAAELTFLKRLLTEVYPTGVVSYVSDTYDYWAVITKLLPALKETILNRQPNEFGLAKFVVRPDSGDPQIILTGDHEAPVGSVEYKGSLEVLWDIFGGTVNEAGYKVLNPHIGLIYGDGITLARAKAILQRMLLKGFASCNIVFGIGSYTYVHSTRDTFGFAIKATWAKVDGQPIDLYKDPKTGSSKKSARGGLDVVFADGDYKLIEQAKEMSEHTALEVIYCDGLIYKTPLDQIRKRLNDHFIQKDASL